MRGKMHRSMLFLLLALIWPHDCQHSTCAARNLTVPAQSSAAASDGLLLNTSAASVPTKSTQPKVRVNILFLTSSPSAMLNRSVFFPNSSSAMDDDTHTQSDAPIPSGSVPWLANDKLDYVQVFTLMRDTQYIVNFNLQQTFATVWGQIVNSTAPNVANANDKKQADAKAPVYHMIVGPEFSSEVKAITQFTSLYNLVVLAGGATSPALADRSRYPYFFRTCPSDADAPDVLANVITHFGYNQLSIIYRDEAFVLDLRDLLEPKFRARDIVIEHSLLYTPHVNRTYMDVAGVMAGTESHIWLLIVSPNHYELICSLYKYGQITGMKYLAFAYIPTRYDSWWFPPPACAAAEQSNNDTTSNNVPGCDYLYKNECTNEQIESVLHGSLLVTTYDTNIANLPIDVVGLRPTQFRDDLRASVGPKVATPDLFSLYLYTQFDAVTAAAVALDRAEKVLRERYNSSMAYFHYNDSRVQNTVFQALSNLSFQGLSGHIRFAPTGDRMDVDWAIQQFQGSDYVDVGLYNAHNATSFNLTFDKPLLFPATGDDELPPQFPRKMSTVNIVVIVVATVLVVSTLVVAGYFLQRRRSKESALRTALANVDHWLIDPKFLIPAAAAKASFSSTSLGSSFSTLPGTRSASKPSIGSLTTTTQTVDLAQHDIEDSRNLPFSPYSYDGTLVCLFPLQQPPPPLHSLTKQQQYVVSSGITIDREFVSHLMAVQACSSHENLASFVGIVQMKTGTGMLASTADDGLQQDEQSGLCMHTVMAASNKGLLFDFLAVSSSNGEVLDEMCRFVLLKDLQAGLAAIHRKLGHHTRLSSLVCMMDNRLSLRISDYGFAPYRKAHLETPADDYENWLWSAPELLATLLASGKKPNAAAAIVPADTRKKSRMSVVKPTASTVAGGGENQWDIYSFGIIATEIFSQSPPFGGHELLLFSSSAEKPAYDNHALLKSFVRDNSKPEALIQSVLNKSGVVGVDVCTLMKRCVAGNPAIRPTIVEIGSAVHVMMKTRKLSGNLTEMLMQRLENYAVNLEQLVEQRTKALRDEENKVHRLLYQILPKTVADALKNGEVVPPQTYESVTIYFSDIKDFTTISAQSTPLEIVDLLNDLYGSFDKIIAKFDVYKVETIGDSYMVVSGLPTPNGLDHVWHIGQMSLKLIDHVISTFKIRHRPNDQLRLRIGIHTGPCAAGVVGFIMPRYCLFGDTVNTASRMESTGEALRIHISEAAAEAMHKVAEYYGPDDNAHKFTVEERGQIEVKGKGVMRTFWLTKPPAE